MTPQLPPSFATFLLEQLHAGSNNQALAGDLCERWHGRRSRVWYWRQVIAAIVVSNMRVVWDQKLRTLAVAVLAYVTWWWIYPAVSGLGFAASIPFGRDINNYLLETDHSWLRWIFGYFSLGDLPMMVPGWLVYAGTGWFVGRTQRGSGVTMVLVLVACTWAIGAQILTYAPWSYFWRQWLVRSEVIHFIGHMITITPCILAPGLIASRRQGHTGQPSLG